MDKCALSAEEQAMLDLKEANKADLAASPHAGPSSTPSRAAAQKQGFLQYFMSYDQHLFSREDLDVSEQHLSLLYLVDPSQPEV